MLKIKRMAFTLAEIVLVLAIIGVVSVLTVTNATKETDENARIISLKKTHADVEAAYYQAISEDGNVTNWELMPYTAPDGSTVDMKKGIPAAHILNRLKLTTDCSFETCGCWATTSLLGSAKYINEASLYNDGNYAKGLLNTGASVAISFLGTLVSNPVGYEGNYIGYVVIDADGPSKGLNKWGSDVFLFYLTVDNGIFPAGSNITISNSTADHCPSNPDLCTAWAFYKGNFDYFKNCATGKLNWSSASNATCKDN